MLGICSSVSFLEPTRRTLVFISKRKGPFSEWFMKFQDMVLSGLGPRYYTSANKVLRGSEANRKLGIFLTPADVALPNGEHD